MYIRRMDFNGNLPFPNHSIVSNVKSTKYIPARENVHSEENRTKYSDIALERFWQNPNIFFFHI